LYLSVFDDSTSHSDHEELTLRFLAFLGPLAHPLKLTFGQASEEVAVDLGVVSTAES